MAMISLDRVTVEFPIYSARGRSLKGELFRRAVGGTIAADAGGRVSVTALRDISLRLVDGDRIGLVGPNGGGKSTLLRVFSGIYEPPVGRVRIEGSLASLTDITMGMDLEETGYENIVLRGVFLGMSIEEARRRIPEVAEFSQLGSFLALPLRTYSSGMLLRLAFSVTTSVTPEIVIMDEMIGTGDADFVVKAQARLERLIGGARILAVASHAPDIVRRFCNKALLIEAGRIVRIGPVEEVLAAYLEPGARPAGLQPSST
jgi:ABC-2 type transport system ATP-binding protein